MAHHFLAQAQQHAGDVAAADATLDAGIEENALLGGHPLTILLYARAYLHFAAGDHLTARNAAERCSACLPSMSHGTEFVELAHGLLGAIHYEWNELDRAAEILDTPECRRQVSGLPSLAKVRLAQGRTEQANALSAESIERTRQSGDGSELKYARAYEAVLLLRQGRGDEALRWAIGADTERSGSLLTFMVCAYDRAHVLIRAGAERDGSVASDLLASVRGIAERGHQTRYLVQVAALEAMLLASQGEEDRARTALATSLELGRRGEFIRSYLDLGPEMRQLLARVEPPPGTEDYVQRLREAFLAEPTHAARRGQSELLLDPLTDRELEILALMGQRLSNKEIGSRLFVALATVKSHAIRIYQKLHVHGRRAAVEKAIALGILPDA